MGNQTLQPCQGCIRSKTHKANIKKTHTKETQPKKELDVLISDLKSMPCEGTGRAKTVGSAIDKKTRFTTLVFLHTKDQWYQRYEAIVRWFKNQKGRVHKIWRTDNGGEFCCKEVAAINAREGIEHSLTPPHTPNKNSTGERFWRTMIEAVGAMLLHAGMAPSWWVEAATYFVYIRNRTKLKCLKWKTPYEKFYKTKPHKVDLKVYGCLSYVLVEAANRSKKDLDKVIPCTHFGIDSSGRYKFRTLEDNKVSIVSDSATFIEDVFPEGKHKHLKHLMQDELEKVLNSVRSIPPSETTTNQNAANLKPILPASDSSPDSTNENADFKTNPPGSTLKNSEEEEDGESSSDEEEDAIDSQDSRIQQPSDNKTLPQDVPSPHMPPLESFSDDFCRRHGIPTIAESTIPLDDVPPLHIVPTPELSNYEHDERVEDPQDPPSMPAQVLRRSTRTRAPSAKFINRVQHQDLTAADLEEGQKPRRKSRRYWKKYPSEGMANSATAPTIPANFDQAMLVPEAPKWKEAIDKELGAVKRTGSMVYVKDLPAGHQAIKCRWVFKIKPANEQEPEIYKARLVAQGFRQRLGIDYDETYAAVAKMTSFRILVALAAAHNTRLTKLDVANAFLESDIDSDVYIHPPQGLPQHGFFKLKKALYGLKQSPRLFQQTLAAEFRKLGFHPTTSDCCIYVHPHSKTRILTVVDDCVIEGNDEAMRQRIEQRLKERFKIKAFNSVEIFIGIQLKHTSTHITLHQAQFIELLLERFNMEGCKIANTPASATPQQGYSPPLAPGNGYRQLIGSLIYLMATRPDICSSVVSLSRHLENPTEAHMQAAKRVLRYLAGTTHKGVSFRKGHKDNKLVVFSDSDWAGCKETRRSTSGFLVYFAGGPISFKSKLQPTTALSSCEAEYVALTLAVKDILFMHQLFKELGVDIITPTMMFGDNSAAIALAKNPVNHQRTKHIDIKHHFLREHIARETIKLAYVPTKHNLADILTKATTTQIFSFLTPKIVSM